MTNARAPDRRLLGVVFAVVAALLLARAFYNAATVPLLADTDDAMRLVVVRDLLAGQGWYDTIQHRLNTPLGAELHWSRLADLPLAAMLVILRPLLGGMSETVSVIVVPLMLMGVLLYLSGRVALALGDREALLAALILPGFSLATLAEFAPGRVDHHSTQMLLAMALVWLSIESVRRPRLGWAAGLAAATGIGIGIEAVPTVVAAIAAFGLMWVGRAERAPAMRNFGLGFAGATLAHLAIGVAPDLWLQPACDAISFTYASAAGLVGAGLALLSALPLATIRARLVAGGCAGAAVVGASAVLFPVCLGGPYAALDPWLVVHWLDAITEAVPLWQSARENPVHALAVGVPAMLAFLACALAIARGSREHREAWWVYATFLAVAVAVMLVQIRGSRIATPIAVPACAWLIAWARHRYLAHRSVRHAGVLVAAWLGSAGVAVGLAGGLILGALPGGAAMIEAAAQASRLRCVAPQAYEGLAEMPRQRAMTPIDLGSHTLLFTPHAVVAAPYHRNQHGIRDALAFFNEPLADARAILESRGIGLVVVCRELPEMRGLASAAADSFVALWEAGRLPDWLEPIALGEGPLEAWRVKL